jgi:hypothetical protein
MVAACYLFGATLARGQTSEASDLGSSLTVAVGLAIKLSKPHLL